MLTLSDSRLTTQTSSFVRAATATGSIPTGIEAAGTRAPATTSKTSSVLSGVLQAKSRLPSGDSARGRTGPLSNAMKDGCAFAGPAPVTRATSGATSRVKSAVKTGIRQGRVMSVLDCGGWRLGARVRRGPHHTIESTERLPGPPPSGGARSGRARRGLPLG